MSFVMELFKPPHEYESKTLVMQKGYMYIEHEYVEDAMPVSVLITLTPEEAYKMAQEIIKRYVEPSKATFDV